MADFDTSLPMFGRESNGSNDESRPLLHHGKGSVCDLAIDGHSHNHQPSSDGNINLVDGQSDSSSSAASMIRIHHLLHHLHNYHQVSSRRMMLLVYMGLTLIYFGVASTLLAANFNDQEFIEERFRLPFHYTEFWSAFLFTLVEAFIIVSADLAFKSMIEIGMVVVVGINVVTSIMAALIFTFEPDTFERTAHFIEYSSQITVTCANFIFIWNSRELSSRKVVYAQYGFASFLLIMAVLKFVFYTDAISVPMGGERSSHFFEFIGEMCNSLWAFIFALFQFVSLSKAQLQHDHRLKDE